MAPFPPFFFGSTYITLMAQNCKTIRIIFLPKCTQKNCDFYAPDSAVTRAWISGRCGNNGRSASAAGQTDNSDSERKHYRYGIGKFAEAVLYSFPINPSLSRKQRKAYLSLSVSVGFDDTLFDLSYSYRAYIENNLYYLPHLAPV